MYHFLLIDTKMPVMNGFELLKEIRKMEEEMKVPK
jgi:CheY-like chemotaxis protein